MDDTSRQKLDGIVQQMTANNESDQNIQAVVSDFKQKYGGAKQSTGFLGGVKNVINSIESPFIGLAAMPVQALAKITGQPDPYASGVPGIGGSTVPITDLSVEKKLGDAAQVASYFVPGEGVLGAMGLGAMQGAGSQMSRGGGFGDVAMGAGSGALVGGATAGLVKGTGWGLSKVGDLTSGKASSEATQGIKDAYTSALNLNASERGFESRSGKDLAQILVDNQAPLGRYENGTLDASAAIEKLQKPLDELNAQADAVLSKPQGVVRDVSLSGVFTDVKDRIQKLTISQSEKNSAVAHAKQLIQDEVGQHGESVTPEIADTIKQGLWGSAFKGKLTSVDKLQGDVSYLTGNTLKTAIEDAVAGTDAGDVLPAINKQRSDLIDAIKRLTNLDGVRLIKGGRLANMGGGVVGTIAGASSGGVLGGIAGDYFGTKAAEFLNNPATKIGIATGKAKATTLVPKLLGAGAEPIGQGVSALGSGLTKLARPAGLLGNTLFNNALPK